MNQLCIHLQRVGADRVRLSQDGYAEQVFTRAELDQALGSEQDFSRALALSEALDFLTYDGSLPEVRDA